MSLTFGFYNSINGDRTYNASELSKLFEGIINDGIFMSIGDHLVVSPSTGMTILVGTGRAWFNNTWTNNDSKLLLSIDPAEVVLNRIDIVVLEIDTTPEVRANSIKVIKGSAASSPSPPSLIVSDMVNQYPLAHVYIGSGVTTITQSNITNKIGTSACPFISGIMSTINIDSLVAQWQNQWSVFYNEETADMEATNAFWKHQWTSWFNSQTAEIQAAYLFWESQWNSWFGSQTDDMEATNAFWEHQWEMWFYNYVNNNTAEMAQWRAENQAAFDDWFSQLDVTLSGDVAANLTNQLLQLKKRTDVLENFSGDLTTEFTVYDKLFDNGYRTYDDLLDSVDGVIIDHNVEAIIGRTYSSELVLDSNGDAINARVIFVTK